MTDDKARVPRRRSGVVLPFLVLLFGLSLAAGCGGDGGSSFRSACYRYCDKSTECENANNAACRMYCNQEDEVRCANRESITQSANRCADMACAGFLTCPVPDCVTQ